MENKRILGKLKVFLAMDIAIHTIALICSICVNLFYNNSDVNDSIICYCLVIIFFLIDF